MATHAQKGSVSVDAVQWTGGTLASFLSSGPYWLKNMALHTPGDGTLHVPIPRFGTLNVLNTEWIVKCPDGSLTILTNLEFTALYS